ncbi:ornithine aminotransferase [Reticulomyxa filosa]|uniref:Ornithine aminotransferase n=1 Tax=Reticulomyxa filosa TaxID=46433 RepID=X6LJK5_RETFI|nr:ornithine aminotransferase [Reticulomyxa filosa]|eukprot:ETO02143.1 ornithine aminotransferase [Reticulomyxa filosa]
MDLETKFGAHNYHPIPAVISRGKGVYVYDVDNKKYFDFLSAYSAVNQGHCHEKIVNTLIEQSQKLTLTSRAFYNDVLGEYCQFVTNFFKYDRVLPMNTGVEACESSVKIARRWAYEKKGVKSNEAIVIFAENNFWGRSIAAVSASTDPDSYTNYGPFVPNFVKVKYSDIDAMRKAVKQHGGEKIAAVMLEPIQGFFGTVTLYVVYVVVGEAGVVIPDKDYLTQVRKLCDEHNILLICDEVQAGLGRCGAMLCGEGVFNVRADMITLGKALSGGLYPISAVCGRDDVIGVLTPGTHGSTYGGNPLACKVAMTALSVLREEKMPQNSTKMGELLLKGLKELKQEFPDIVTTVRGQGLFCAIEIVTNEAKNLNAWEVCMLMKDRGLLAKPTHEYIIRLAPPLIINEKEIHQALDIIRSALKETKQKLA